MPVRNVGPNAIIDKDHVIFVAQAFVVDWAGVTQVMVAMDQLELREKDTYVLLRQVQR